MTLQEQKNCPMISSKATVASRNSLHWSCKTLIRLRKILASRSLEKGRSVRVADREGIAFARCIDPHPPRCARRPPLFKAKWSKWHTRCDTPRTEVVRANAKCDSPAARGQRWSERRSRRVHLWSEITSRQPGIDVSGIGLDRQGSEPAADRVGAQPGCVHELLAFAQHRIV